MTTSLNKANDDKTVELTKMISLLNKANEDKIDELTEKMSALSKTNAEKDDKIADQAKRISTLNSELSKLKSKESDLSELVKQMNGKADIGLNREKIDFEFCLGSIEYLRLEKTLKSEVHFCNNLAWTVETLVETVDKKEYLSVYLRATSLAGDKASWSADMNFKFKLLKSPGFDSIVASNGHRAQFANSFLSWGYRKFIAIDELKTNDACWKIRVDLEVANKNDEIGAWNCFCF